MLKYKRDILQELKKQGFSSYVLTRRGLFGNADIQKMRGGIVSGIVVLDRLCELLHCQPGDILEHVPDPVQDQETHAHTRARDNNI